MPSGPGVVSPYTFGFGGGSSRATTWSEKFARWCAPSQNGLFSEWPQRHNEITVRPARPNAAPVGSQISNSPSIRIEPLLLTVILDGMLRIISRAAYCFFAGAGVLESSTGFPYVMVDLPSYRL